MDKILTMLDNIPILAYHKISNTKEFGLTTVSPDKFNQHLTILKKLGFDSITFKDIANGDMLPKKPVIITFDDGYESVYDIAMPLMHKHGFNGVVYIITDYIDKYNTWEAVSFQQKHKHLSMSQVTELQGKGFEIASHGKSHRYLSLLQDEDVRSELLKSKKILEDQTGDRVISFCYPYGRSNKRVREIVQQTGYKFATQNLSLSKSSNNNLFSLERRNIYASDTSRTFIDKIDKSFILTFSRLSESIIQKGALASISITSLRNIFSRGSAMEKRKES